MGVLLSIVEPGLPTCARCQAWMHDKDWKLSKRGGKPIPRIAAAPPPCYKCPKSSDGRPNPEAELSAKNSQALEYCQALRAGAAPRTADPIVLRNAAVVQEAMDAAQRILDARQLAALRMLARG